jgi:general secretion pathway protein A
MSFVEYFGMKKEPFMSEISSKDLIVLPQTSSIKQRMNYLLLGGGVMIITGEVGTGKTTSIRYGLEQFHPNEILSIYVTATSGGINEVYKQIAWELGCQQVTSSRASLIKTIKERIRELIKERRGKILIVIDEASLLRSEIISEIHTMTQFDFDSKNLFSLVLVGQIQLIDKIKSRTATPLASRVVTKVHLEGLDRDRMKDYIEHHIKISGLRKVIFSENAITAIHLHSQGLLRRANLLARGALLATAADKMTIVNEEHVRMSSTELL